MPPAGQHERPLVHGQVGPDAAEKRRPDVELANQIPGRRLVGGGPAGGVVEVVGHGQPVPTGVGHVHHQPAAVALPEPDHDVGPHGGDGRGVEHGIGAHPGPEQG